MLRYQLVKLFQPRRGGSITRLHLGSCLVASRESLLDCLTLTCFAPEGECYHIRIDPAFGEGVTNPDRRARCRALSRASTARGVSEPHDSNQREVFNLNSTAHNLPRTGRNETDWDARDVTSGGVRHAYMRLAKIR